MKKLVNNDQSEQAPTKKFVKRLPKEEALFEFDFDDGSTAQTSAVEEPVVEAQTEVEEVAEEPVVEAQAEVEEATEEPIVEAQAVLEEAAEEPVVEAQAEVEEAAEELPTESAESITEKFGFIKDLGAAFIDEGEKEADTALEELIKEHEAQLEEVSEELHAPQTTEEAEAPIAEQSVDTVATEEVQPAEQIVSESEDTTDQPQDDDDDDDDTQQAPSNEEFYTDHKSADALRVGVQLTFLDTAIESEQEKESEPEQSPEPEKAPEEFSYLEKKSMTIAQRAEAEQLEEESEQADEEPETTDEVSEQTEISDAEDDVQESAEESTEEAVEDAPKQEEELTAIEESALEEEERIRREAEEILEEEQDIIVEEFDEDIWDEQDRKLWIAKKRYTDYCASLVVPPLKVTKDTPAVVKRSTEAPKTSGYRYEMTERLPLFPDGINGGKDTDGYFKREMEYCEDREAKRSVKLLDKLRSSWRKTIFALAVMLSVILLEGINLFMSIAPEGVVVLENIMVFSIIDAALLLIGALLIIDSIRDGIKYAFKGIFIPETLTAGVTVLSIIYHVALVFSAGSSYAILLASPAAIAIFLCALYRHNMLKRQYVAFSVASSFGSYTTEVKMLGFNSTPEGKAFEGYVDTDASLYKLNKVSRIDACYTDKTVRDECYGVIRKLSLCIICAALVAGVVFGLLNRSVLYGALSALSLVSMAAPISVFIAMFLPRVRTANASADAGAALVDFDDESDELDESVIMLDDAELFPPDKLVSSGFEMQRSERLEMHLTRTYALFKKIGGTLASIFTNMEGGLEKCRDITITEISDGGVAARIDGRMICAGSENFLNKYGVKVKRYDRLLPKNGRVMYIADDGVFFARAILTFKPDEELVAKIARLRNTGTVFSLKTCNPCIDRELLFYTTGLEPELVRLIKYEAGDDVAPAETDREGCLVSKNGASGLITALIEYKRQKRLVFRASRFACFACGIGAFVSLLTSAIGIGFGFTSLISLTLHTVLSLAAIAVGKGK